MIVLFEKTELNSQYFARFVIANGDPIRLCGSPLNLIHFTLGSCVRQNRVFNSTWHLLNVPD